MKQLKWITVLFAVLALVLGGAVLAETIGTDGNITWELTGDGTLLISGNGPMEDYSFSHVDEQYRTTAPWGCEFTSVVIEAGVTSIGRNAFYGCESLTTVTFSEGIADIGDSAFRLCKGLQSIALPTSVTAIGQDAF